VVDRGTRALRLRRLRRREEPLKSIAINTCGGGERGGGERALSGGTGVAAPP